MFSPSRLAPLDNKGLLGVFLGAAVIFVAYEGFELVPYDYDDISEPRRTLPRALYLSVAVVVVVYVAVTIASQMLLPDQRDRRAQKEVAFAVVGQKALGTSDSGRRPWRGLLHQLGDQRDAVLDRPPGARRQRGPRAPGPSGSRTR